MIFLTGDCHGDYRKLSTQTFRGQKEMDRNDYLIVLGDFGYWHDNQEETYWLDWLAEKDFTILWVDGNHENFDRLGKLPIHQWHGGKVHFIRENVIHLMRGQMFSLNGKSFFTFGGASSHDIQDGILERNEDDPDYLKKWRELEEVGARFRINHLTWWKEELPSPEEYEEGRACLEKNNWKCDYILSHCAPTSILGHLFSGSMKNDELTEYFENIKHRCKYKGWYFGHYHADEIIDERHRVLYHDILRIV